MINNYNSNFDLGYVEHHGILNQKWGVRLGPPYPLQGGAYRRSRDRMRKYHTPKKNSVYNKRHFDQTLRAGKDVLSTLSFAKDRTRGADMFYATHTMPDKIFYGALFNKKKPQPILDDDGNVIDNKPVFKYKIDNDIKSDMKVASEDSGAKIFRNLYEKDRDFYNFVTDDSRMESYFNHDKYGFKGYRETRDVLNKLKSDKNYIPSQDDMQKIYRMFNYVIPYDGEGDSRKGKDVTKQRCKFFEAAKKEGYGALLDTNDAIYGKFHAQSPVIVFDMDAIIPKSVKQTSIVDYKLSQAALPLAKFLQSL